MRFLSERISVSEKPGALSIVISPNIIPIKQTLLLTWLVFWTIGGLVVFSQFFYEYNNEIKLFLVVWMFFWLYFEYIVLHAFLWRKYGFERILVKNGKLSYKRDIKGRGKTKIYDLEFIRNVETVNNSNPSFFNNLMQSYWAVGGETIKFDYYSKTVLTGLQLEKEEALKLIRVIKSKL